MASVLMVSLPYSNYPRKQAANKTTMPEPGSSISRMDGLNIEELHSTIVSTYQNILDLSPVFKEVAAASKQYYKSLQNVSSSSLAFQQALGKLSQSANCSRGPAKPLGNAIDDIVRTHRDIENRRAEILKFMLNDFISPLDSLLESDLLYVKSVQKNYNQDNKARTEVVDKAKGELLKVRKKSQRKKPTEKYEEKEKQCEGQLDKLQKELETFRRESCMKSLSEEWKRYCFIVDRASIVLKSCMDFYDHNAAMLREKIPTWFAQVKKKPPGGEEANGTDNAGMYFETDDLDAGMDSNVKLQAVFDHNAIEGSQLSFQQGDIIDPISDIVSGWQYGQNMKTERSGWFPAAYTQGIIAVPTGSTVSQTMPVSGVHSRPQLDAPNVRSLKRFASEGPTSIGLPLPVPDYGDAHATELTTNGNHEPGGSESSTPSLDKPASAPSSPTTPIIHPTLGAPPPPPPPPPTPPPDEDDTIKSSPLAKKMSTDDKSSPSVDVVHTF